LAGIFPKILNTLVGKISKVSNPASVNNIDGFIFIDKFSNDLSAGSVDLTTGTPGPLARDVVDTTNKLSVNSGNLVFSACNSAGDPGYWLNTSLSRSVGRMLISSVTPAQTNNIFQVGFDSGKGGSINRNSFIFRDTGKLSVYQTSTIGPELITYTARNYICAITLRAIGAMFLLKTTNWKLLYIDDRDNYATLYPAITSSTTSATFSLISDYVVIPSDRWLPTPLYSDGFSSWGTSDGLGHVEGVNGGVGSGGSGIAITGSTWNISSGYAYNTPTDDNTKFAIINNITTSSPMIDGIWHSIATGQDHGYLVNSSSATIDFSHLNGVLIYYNGTASIITEQYIDGSKTALGSQSVTWAADKRFNIRIGAVSVDDIDIYFDNTKIGNTLTKNAALIGKYHGIYSTATGNKLDSLAVYDVNSGTFLDKFLQ
jgi:hypothetical protein